MSRNQLICFVFYLLPLFFHQHLYASPFYSDGLKLPRIISEGCLADMFLDYKLSSPSLKKTPPITQSPSNSSSSQSVEEEKEEEEEEEEDRASSSFSRAVAPLTLNEKNEVLKNIYTGTKDITVHNQINIPILIHILNFLKDGRPHIKTGIWGKSDERDKMRSTCWRYAKKGWLEKETDFCTITKKGIYALKQLRKIERGEVKTEYKSIVLDRKRRHSNSSDIEEEEEEKHIKQPNTRTPIRKIKLKRHRVKSVQEEEEEEEESSSLTESENEVASMKVAIDDAEKAEVDATQPMNVVVEVVEEVEEEFSAQVAPSSPLHFSALPEQVRTLVLNNFEQTNLASIMEAPQLRQDIAEAANELILQYLQSTFSEQFQMDVGDELAGLLESYETSISFSKGL